MSKAVHDIIYEPVPIDKSQPMAWLEEAIGNRTYRLRGPDEDKSIIGPLCTAISMLNYGQLEGGREMALLAVERFDESIRRRHEGPTPEERADLERRYYEAMAKCDAEIIASGGTRHLTDKQLADLNEGKKVTL